MDLLHVSGGAGHQRACKQSLRGQRATAASAASARHSSVSSPIRRAMSSRLTVSRVATRPRPSHRLLYYYAITRRFIHLLCLSAIPVTKSVNKDYHSLHLYDGKKSRRMKELHLRLRWSASAGDDRVPDEVGKTHGEMIAVDVLTIYFVYLLTVTIRSPFCGYNMT